MIYKIYNMSIDMFLDKNTEFIKTSPLNNPEILRWIHYFTTLLILLHYFL